MENGLSLFNNSNSDSDSYSYSSSTSGSRGQNGHCTNHAWDNWDNSNASAVHELMLSRHHHHYQKQGYNAHPAASAAGVPRCQVEGCHMALVNAKDYHRRHKVCEKHAKAPQVVVLGLDQRFCQQCSRFHLVSEFDDTKKSCRRRLAGHNERRRKGFYHHDPTVHLRNHSHQVTRSVSKLSESSAPALKRLDDNPEQYRYKIRKEPPEKENMMEESYPQIVKENSLDIHSSAARKIVIDTYVPGPRMSNSVACQSLEKQEFLSLCKLPNSSPALENLDDSQEQCGYKIRKDPREGKNMMQESYPQVVKKKPPDILLSTARKIVNDIYVQGPCMSNSVACLSLEKQEFLSLCKLPNSSPALENLDDSREQYGYKIQKEPQVVKKKTPDILLSTAPTIVNDIYVPGPHMSNSVACQSLEKQESLSFCKLPTSSPALENLDDTCDPGLDTPNSVACQPLENQEFLSLCQVPNSSAALESLDYTCDSGFVTPHSVVCKSLENQGCHSLCKVPNSSAALESLDDFCGHGLDTPISVACQLLEKQEFTQPWPIQFGSSSHWCLPDGGQIVQLDSLEQSTNDVAYGAEADQSCPTVSVSDKKTVRKTLKRKCRTMSVSSSEDLQQHFGRRCEDAANIFGVSVSTLKRICRQREIHRWPFRHEKKEAQSINLYWPQPQKLATMKGCSFGEKRPGGGEIVEPTGLSLSNFAATNNRGHLVRKDQSGSTASHSEKKNTSETSTREWITRSVFSFENLHQHFGCRHGDAEKGLSVSVSTTDALGLHRLSIVKRICRQHGLHRLSIVKRICRQRGIHQWSFRQKWATMKGRSFGEERSGEVIGLSMDEKLDSRLQFINIPHLARSSPRPLALPDGGDIVAPIALSSSDFAATNNRPHLVGKDQSGSTAFHSEKKNTSKTSKKEWITKSVFSLENLHQHFGGRRGVAEKGLSVNVSALKRICRQHGIHQWPYRMKNNDSGFKVKRIWRQHGIHRPSIVRRICSQRGIHRWPFRQRIWRQHGIHWPSTVKRICQQRRIHRWPFRRKWATMKGRSLGEKRSAIVIILSRDEKLDSRLQYIHISQLARFSPWLPDGGDVGPIASSLSQFPATNNRAHLVREDRSGSTGSHSEKKNTRETSQGRWINKSFLSLEDLQQQFGRKREDAAKTLGVSVSTLKRICRLYGIPRWPNRVENMVWKPPDPQEEKNPSPPTNTTLSTDGHTEMENEIFGHLEELNGFVSDFIEGSNCWNTENGISISSIYKESVEAGGSSEFAFHLKESMPSTADPNPSALVLPQPSAQMVTSENVASPEYWRNVLAATDAFMRSVSVTLKVTYRNTIIKFQLPLTSGITELKDQVSKRLKLELDSFDVKYEDEDTDLILIACDEDLRDYLQLSSSLGNQVIKLRVVDNAIYRKKRKVANATESCRVQKRKRS